MVQKLVLRNEVIKVKGHVKAITVKKEDFFKILKLTKLRILDNEYSVLMPPIDGLQKNTIDFNGLATIIQQYISIVLNGANNNLGQTPAKMVLTTQSGNVTFSYSNSISLNTQGVTVYLQVLRENNSYTFQYFYVGFDTTNASYSTSQLELYASAYVIAHEPDTNQNPPYYTNIVRIAYTNTSFTKSSDSYLFIVWLIEFQNIPPYLLLFTPTLVNNVGIALISFSCFALPCSSAIIYFSNGNCNFACGGNCPSSGLGGFITYVQNNSVILEFPLATPLGTGVTNVEVMLCTYANFAGIPGVPGSTSATITPPVSGATFYVAIATLVITYQGS